MGLHVLLYVSSTYLECDCYSLDCSPACQERWVPEQCASHAQIAPQLPPLLPARHPASSREQWVLFRSIDATRLIKGSAA